MAASRLEPDATPAGDVYGGAGFSSFSTFDALAVVRRALYTGPSIGYTGPSIGGEQDLAAVPTEFDSRDILGGDFQQFAVPRLMFQQFAVPVLMPRYSTLAMARINGGPGNAYARGQWAVDWGEGTYYRSEMSVLLPHGFYAHQQGAVQVMGWDTFPVLDNHMRLIVWEQDQRARLYLKSDGVDSILTSAFTIPEGRWTRLVVEQRIATVDGWSRVYMDGQLVAHGSGSTSTGYPITRMRYGLVAIDEAAQSRPLSIWLRDVLLVTLPPEAHFAALGQTRC